MSENALYNLLELNKIYTINKLAIIKKAYAPSVISLTAAAPIASTEADNRHYFLIDLPNIVVALDNKYTLKNHHISVTEHALGANDAQSQYHYTAVFVDAEDKEHKVHVYFNFEDEYLENSGLKLTVDGVACAGDYQEEFIALAKEQVAGVRISLREKQEELTKKLKEEIHALETDATELVKDLQNHKAAFILNIQQQIEKMKRLRSYSNPPKLSEIDRAIKGLELLKIAIEQKPAELEVASENDDRDRKDEKVELLNVKTSLKEKPPGKDNSATKIKKKFHLNKDITELEKKFETIKTQKDVVGLADLYATLSELEHDIKNNGYEPRPGAQEMLDLHELKRAVSIRGKNVLEQLLKRPTSDDPKIAEQLTKLRGMQLAKADQLYEFFKYLDSNIWLNKALTDNDAELLDFLLKNKIVSVRIKHFFVENVPYESIVHYLFRKNEKLPCVAIAKCMSALVKNGASLMELDSANGLPYAANILMNTAHPFFVALKDNLDLTINSKEFYKKLNQILASRMSSASCSSKDKENIKLLIAKNERICPQLMTNLAEVSLAAYAQDEAVTLLGVELVERVRKDRQVTLLIQEATKRVNIVLKKHLGVVKKHYLSHSPDGDINTTALPYIKALTGLGRTLSFEELKQETIDYFTILNKLLDLIIKADEYERKISSNKTKKHKPGISPQVKLLQGKLLQIELLICQKELLDTQRDLETIKNKPQKVIEEYELMKKQKAVLDADQKSPSTSAAKPEAVMVRASTAPAALFYSATGIKPDPVSTDNKTASLTQG